MPYIDFDRVKEMVSFSAVLKLLNWRHVRREAGWYRGPCPVHRSSRASADCFAVREGGWKCHSCGRHGDQIRLWAEATRQEQYRAVLDLCGRLGLEVPLKVGAGQRFPR